MADVTQSPGSIVDDASIGTVTWSNPSNAASSDDSYATAAVVFNQTHYLWCDDFGFSIPSGATIQGIEVKVEASYSGGFSCSLNHVRLIKGGTITGDDNGGQAVTGTDTVYTFGGAADLWGASWAYSDINASNFGAAVTATGAFSTARVDHIQIKVTYTTGGTVYNESITLSAVATQGETPDAESEGSASLAAIAEMTSDGQKEGIEESASIGAAVASIAISATAESEGSVDFEAVASDGDGGVASAEGDSDIEAFANIESLGGLNSAGNIALDASAGIADTGGTVSDNSITFSADAGVASAGDVVGLTVSSEKRNPGSIGTSGSGDMEWQEAGNVEYSDNRRAWCDIYQPNLTSNKLQGSNFGFQIPSNATIEGVEVTVEHRAQPADDIEISVNLMVDFIENGNSEDDFTRWPYNDSTMTFGSDSSTWGLSLTSQTINANGFGFSLYIQSASGPSIAGIDNVYMTVYYSTSGTATAEEALEFGAVAGMELVSDLGGTNYDDSVVLTAYGGIAGSLIQNVQSGMTLNAVPIIDVLNDKEDIDVKMILADGTVKAIERRHVFNVIEDTDTEHVVLVYQDESSRVYETGGNATTVEVVLKPNTFLRDFMATLRTEMENIRLYYRYKSEPTNYKIVRVHPLVPFNYAHGGLDGDELLRMIFYEQIT